MDSGRAFHRARLPLCIVAAFVAHGLAATALPAHAHRATAAALADAPATPVDMEPEGAPASESTAEVTERAAAVATPSPRAPSAARAQPAAAAAKETVANPEDSSSESTEPSTGDGWSDGDGANGSGRGARGGGGSARGSHDHHALGARGSGTSPRRGVSGKAALEPGRDWSDCPFPKDAKRRTAFVRISVVVDASGNAQDVKVLSDPGEGFGESATVCAKRRHYVAGTNDDGEKAATETEPFLVYFTR